MFLVAVGAFANEINFFHAFFSQRFDIVIIEILMFVGWIPAASVLVWGLLEIWKDYRQEMYEEKLRFVLLAVDVPKMTEQSPKSLENFFASLQGAFSNYLWKEIWFMGKTPPCLAFEIASIDGFIQFYIRCEDRHRDIVEAGIYAQYPDAQISEVEDYMDRFPSNFPNPEWELWGSEIVVESKGEYLPFKTWPQFEHGMSQELKDPLAVMLEQLSRMRPGENFVVQILVRLTSQKWKDEGAKFINKVYGVKEPTKAANPFADLLNIPGELVSHITGIDFGGSAEPKKDDDIWRAFKITNAEKAAVEGVANKIGKIGFKTKIRLVYVAKKGVYAKHMRVAMIKGMLGQYNNPGTAEFKLYGPQTPKNDYFWQRWTYTHRQTRLAQALKNRSFSKGASAKIMNTEELATIYHFPSVVVKAPLVKKTESRRAEPPVSLPVTSDDTPMFQNRPAVAPTTKRESPPINLPTMEIPAPKVSISLESNIDFGSSIKQSRSASVSSKTEKKIPDALRVLMDPGVELEDISLPPIPTNNSALDEKEKSFTPPNLPI
jgi:hypothetical protein